MVEATTAAVPTQEADLQADGLEHLVHTIEHIAHVLPSQGPIQVFIHHNTLHAFEHLSFHDAVKQGGATYGCHPYLPEDRYRQHLARGRIQFEDLAAVLIDDLGEEADHLVSFLGTRHQLRLAMLEHPLRLGPDAELRWLIAETDALRRFREETPPSKREQMIEQTRRWVLRDLSNGSPNENRDAREALASLFEQFGAAGIENWNDATWEAFTLHALWRICHQGVHAVPRFAPLPAPLVRHRDIILQATGIDTDRIVHDVLIRFCGAFLDQGIADWPLPTRELGFFQAFVELYKDARQVDGWLSPLGAELHRIADAQLSAAEVIDENLRRLGVSAGETEEFLSRTMLALRGWAGMIWQMETNAEWIVHRTPHGSLLGFVAVRLLLDRLAVEYVARTELGNGSELQDLRSLARSKIQHASRVSVEQRTFLIFQLAQVLGWTPEALSKLAKSDWSRLVEEIETFSALDRRRIFHLAFERRYRNQVLDAFLIHSQHVAPPSDLPTFQICCCLDEREESFRRHLEEVEPRCETYAFAGFFAVAMYYRGAVEAHHVPLCPILIKPQHYVEEEVVYSLEQTHRARQKTRRVLGKAKHKIHLGSRSGLAGALASIVGSLASIPLVARVLFPRITARVSRLFDSLVQPPALTRLTLERSDPTPGPENGHLGFSLTEMTGIVERVLRDIGLTKRFSRLVIIAGHGSSSMNNPHRAAYDCGACGGGCGGPNARAYAFMANDPRVREALAQRGIRIPPDTFFIGAMHNTCDDTLTFSDLDRLPPSHRGDFEQASAVIKRALCRNAHERCRRFESAPLSITPEAAHRHVEARSEDLAQVRPELGHATNAVCYVGRRWRSQGLFLDRRTFLTSYDPTQDDAERTILTRILQPAVPVCAGISLEYLFSYVDSTGYGCGSKLPHNIASLVGVMDGPVSDLRTGLPWQMVEIHEPLRILFLVESTPAAMQSILEKNPVIQQLVVNEWIQLALLDPDSPSVQLYRAGRFEPYVPESKELPIVSSSVDWYRGSRDHLGFASIVPNVSRRISSKGQA